MSRTDVIIIGGGQAGLAMSRCLTARAIDHVVLERGRVAERWRSSVWDSLRLLTPNWMTRLPGWSYRGRDPDDFMSRDQLVGHLEDYAASFDAPLQTGTTVRAVTRHGDRYRVATDRGTWDAAVVVVATGHCEAPLIPGISRGLSPRIRHLTPASYKRAEDLPPGGVLVIGASASGAQLAEEIHASGRPVTLAVGDHTRLPRRYGGRDILWWLDRIGMLAERSDTIANLEAALRQPSLQLIGAHRQLDLNTLQAAGIRLVGRAVHMSGTRVDFADDLAATIAHAEQRMARVLGRLDKVKVLNGLPRGIAPAPIEVPAMGVPTRLDLADEGIGTVLWATGYRRNLSWLRVPVCDARGEILHTGGVTAAPGLYALGFRLLRRRNSSFIDGVGRDAEELAEHIAARLYAQRYLAA
jgi:putative flavoprotein involved in K+ transport